MKNTKELIGLVRKEASSIKKKAKKHELSFLDFKNLRPEHSQYCIYGQMTGSCYNARATELIQSCTERVYKQQDGEELYLIERNEKTMFDIIIGDRNGDYFSPIECFITNPLNESNGNNLALINYLKGKSKKLIIK